MHSNIFHFLGVLTILGQKLFSFRLFIGLAAVVLAALFVTPGNPYGKFKVLGFGISALLIAIGIGLRAWGSAYAGKHTRTATIEAPHLVTDGPYQHVRNPIYLGNIILGFGMVGLIGDFRLLPIHVITCAILYFTIIPAEEAFLTRTFGQEFRNYCASVPRLIPRLRLPNLREPGSNLRNRANWRLATGEIPISILLSLILLFLHGSAHLRGL